MLQYVEVVLGDRDDAAVRRAWSALSAHGLPSLNDHRGASNRPHVTLTVVTDWPEPGPADPLAGSPMRVPLGPLALFGRDPVTLVRAVIVTPALLALREDLVAELGPPARRYYETGRWVPHLTLATRLPKTQVEAALDALADAPLPEEVSLTATRRWDAEARVVVPLR
jgi:2'-5' RNA ligase